MCIFHIWINKRNSYRKDSLQVLTLAVLSAYPNTDNRYSFGQLATTA